MASQRRSRASRLAFSPTAFEPSLTTRLLVLQPTPFCNIDCDYCYLPNRSDASRMSMRIARAAVERLADDGLLGSSLTVVWHAGEPLVLPPAYYDEAFDVVADAAGAGCSIRHSIQTNGTLISDAWCDLFSRRNVQVGVSVDGPRDLHDRHRRTRNGNGTHDKTLAGMARLREHGIAFHAIAVITQPALGRAPDLRDFFVESGVAEVGMNFDEAEGVHATSSLQGAEAAHQAFVEATLDLSIASQGRYRVREFCNALRLIAREPDSYRYDGRTLPDNAQCIPFAIVSVLCNGDFSTFSPELAGQSSAAHASFTLGNVASTGYFEAAAGEAFGRLWDEILDGVSACEAECPYFRYCGGGAPVNKLYENGTFRSAETLYCRSMFKRPFEAVLRAIEDGRARALAPSTDAAASAFTAAGPTEPPPRSARCPTP
jgi:uncharacterized protein